VSAHTDFWFIFESCFNHFNNHVFIEVFKIIECDAFFFFQEPVYLCFPSANKGSVQEIGILLVVGDIGGVAEVEVAIMENLGNFEHQSIESSPFANDDFPLV